MNNQNQSTTAQKRKFLLRLPILVLPFLIMTFGALDGGKAEAAGEHDKKLSGINTKLPDANLKQEKGLDKMSFYDQAQRDSIKARELSGARADQQLPPVDSNRGMVGYADPLNTGSNISMNTSPYGGPGFNAKEERINQKLQQLNYALNTQQSSAPMNGNAYQNATGYQPSSESLQRLEKMMQQMQATTPQEDKETAQLDGLLEKVLDIQNPERVREKIRKSSLEHKGQVFAVLAAQKREIISQLNGTIAKGVKEQEGNGFYSLEDATPTDSTQNTIAAVIHETQSIVNGSTVKLRLMDEIFINGRLVPKNTFIYGEASLNGERLSIKISGIQYKKSQYPVVLSVYDIDGMDGIYIPGAIARDVAKQSADRAVQGIQFDGMNPSLGIQAASAGIEAAKSLFSKKIKLIRVTLKAGYQVLLVDQKQKQQNQ